MLFYLRLNAIVFAMILIRKDKHGVLLCTVKYEYLKKGHYGSYYIHRATWMKPTMMGKLLLCFLIPALWSYGKEIKDKDKEIDCKTLIREKPRPLAPLTFRMTDYSEIFSADNETLSANFRCLLVVFGDTYFIVSFIWQLLLSFSLSLSRKISLVGKGHVWTEFSLLLINELPLFWFCLPKYCLML